MGVPCFALKESGDTKRNESEDANWRNNGRGGIRIPATTVIIRLVRGRVGHVQIEVVVPKPS